MERGPKYEYDNNDRKQRNTAVHETCRVDDRWHGMLEVVYRSNGKRPKTLYGFVIVNGTPKS